ncbi:MAG: UPF0175 family protein [Hyphomicrobiales bacterium]|nr:UPF0175 family protein [Hyphomicrobiales bacterium]
MDVVVHIPEDLARRLESVGDLPRRVLETIAVEEYRLGRLSQADLRHVLGLGTRQALDALLKAHEVYLPYTTDDLEQDRNDLRRLGF